MVMLEVMWHLWEAGWLMEELKSTALVGGFYRVAVSSKRDAATEMQISNEQEV
jgi:hypothetical protein